MTPGIIANSTAVAAAPASSRRWQIDVRFVAPILITFILLIGQVSVRGAGKLPENPACHRLQPAHGVGFGAADVWQMAPSGERVCFGDQRGNFNPFAVLLALRAVRRAFHSIEICDSGEQSASVESVEFRDCRDAGSGSAGGRDVERAVGKYALAYAGRLDARFRDCVAPEPIPYLFYLRSFVYCIRGASKRVDGAAFRGGSFADYRPDVSVVYFLHDYRSKKHGLNAARTNSGRVQHRGGRMYPAAQSQYPRAVFRAVSGWPVRQQHRNLANEARSGKKGKQFCRSGSIGRVLKTPGMKWASYGRGVFPLETYFFHIYFLIGDCD